MRLRRTLLRGSSMLLVSAVGFIALGAAVLSASMSATGQGIACLGLGVLLVALWWRVFTAWAEFDDDGVRWRFWARSEYLWPKIIRIDLTERRRLTSDSGTPVIVVQWRGSAAGPADSDDIRPARGGGRHRREFGAALLEAAAKHGVRTRVRSSRWGLPVSDPDPGGWS